jgi:hypothetical protein
MLYLKNTSRTHLQHSGIFPTLATVPAILPTEALIIAAEELTEALQNPQRTTSELLVADITTQLDSIFQVSQRDAPSPRVEALLPDTQSPRVEKVSGNQPIAQCTCSHVPEEPLFMVNAVIHPVTRVAMEYCQLIQDPITKEAWQQSAANEFGRLVQGVGGRIKGTNTIRFIPHTNLPAKRMPTYPRFVCEVCEQKAEKFRTRLTLGGNLIDYPGEVSTQTAKLETTKCLFNSTISTLNARFCSMDITNFYLNTPMDCPEFVQIPAHLIPDEIMEEYHLALLVHQGMVLAIVEKGMYDLSQAGALANALLKQHLELHGYFECTHTPGLWQHWTRPIMFALVVNDFGIQYTGKEHAEHLLETLLRDYEAVTVDWGGSLFCGITLDWNYEEQHVNLLLR